MSKSKWKPKFIHSSILKLKEKRKKDIWCKSSVVPSFLVGCFVRIYNGKEFIKIFISKEKVGYKFGEFVFTRKKKISKKKTKDKKKWAKK